jgi:hypothetical protein
MRLSITDPRHHVQNTPISQTKTPQLVDGAMLLAHRWEDPEQSVLPIQDAGTAVDHINVKIAQTTISTIRCPWSQATRARGRARRAVTARRSV